MEKPRASDDGFTLIELLVVIIIIGILASIAIPNYLRQREKGYRTAAVSDMKNAALALETYATDQPGNSYLGANGADQNSPILQGEGFRSTQWVSVLVTATDNSYCVQGENANLPGETFVFRSTAGQVEIGLSGTLTCP